MRVTFTVFRNIILGALLLILGSVLGYRYAQTGLLPLGAERPLTKVLNTAIPVEHQNVSFATFWEVWDELERDYLKTDKIVPATMVDGAISGMTASLGDPYTVYLPPVDNQRSGEDLAGSFYGVGIELGYVDNTLAVVAPLKDMPADKAGVLAGDLILHLKDESKGIDEDTNGLSLVDAVDKIRGKAGSTITLTLYRKEKGEPFTVALQRAEIVVKTVEVTYIEKDGKKVANLRLSRFGERTPDEWDQAVNDILRQRDLTGVVLDMRNNPGGFFDGAISIASEFIENGVVVSQKGKTATQNYDAVGKARLANMPVEVLVNRGSASAAEIVAGALRDQRGAKLIGEKTFGKGSVQDRRELSNGGGLHVTIAEWLLPKGAFIHGVGIPVDIEVVNDPNTEADEILDRAIQEL